MLATEPLPDEFWAEVGWRQRVTLNDARRLIVYARRTRDGRIAFGGRGAPYRFGSRLAATSELARGCTTRCGAAWSKRTRLPWVGHRSPPFEPEPLRWIGMNAGFRLAAAVDRREQRTERPAVLLDRVMRRLTGH